MNDRIVEPEDPREIGVVAATCVAALLLVIALISTVMLACRGSGFGLVTANSHHHMGLRWILRRDCNAGPAIRSARRTVRGT